MNVIPAVWQEVEFQLGDDAWFSALWSVPFLVAAAIGAGFGAAVAALHSGGGWWEPVPGDPSHTRDSSLPVVPLPLLLLTSGQ